MKKFATVLLALVMALSTVAFVACQSTPSGKDAVGTWKNTAISVTVDGKTFVITESTKEADVPAEMKPFFGNGLKDIFLPLGMTFALKDDNSVSFDDWSADGANAYNAAYRYISGASTWSLEDKNLALSLDGAKALFMPSDDGYAFDGTAIMNGQVGDVDGLPEFEKYLLIFIKQ